MRYLNSGLSYLFALQFLRLIRSVAFIFDQTHGLNHNKQASTGILKFIKNTTRKIT